MTNASRSGDSSLSARLAAARQRMAALDLPRPLAARLQRQFIAVCDAVKAAGADEAHGERRLAAFLAALDRAAGADPARSAGTDPDRPAGADPKQAAGADPKHAAGADRSRSADTDPKAAPDTAPTSPDDLADNS